ncbi:SRPBCC family protein [Steroidobacter sp. S1-65]|uniref:SRPBCC family protein n=1 Tax=Steroidobacter gossypii TaxID=2805490 RepID=A0ABS1WWB6_9GAMM|nr:SRPBCC family protein [Steroidobacter gossypii]MBM0105248.1 SRPBCC family protein [Steroidobacter gossypii]
MASIRREVLLHAPLDQAWDALRDIGALHTRLVPGFVVDTTLEDGARIVTFGNGMVVKELIVDIDEPQRRVCWSAAGTALTHHNASFQLFKEAEERTRGVWIADLLPHEAATDVAAMIEEGLAAMKRVFG